MDFPNNSKIEAGNIQIGRDFNIGSNVNIKVRGQFRIGDFGRFGNNVNINAENVDIGDHFFHYTDGLNIGGGGSQFPYANLVVGDRCVFHNNYINLAREVGLGNDVGLSPDVDIITHGFWNSVLEGYPAKYEGVYIDDGVIVGQRSIILAGCNIAKNIIVGAGSVITRNLDNEKSIYAGNPADFVRTIIAPNQDKKIQILTEVLSKYNLLSPVYNKLEFDYPFIIIDDALINVEAKTIIGTETITTDKFRDYLRRWGIRIYTDRPFVSL